MPIRETSREAYDRLTRTGNLPRRQAEVLLGVMTHFRDSAFTRKELAKAMCWDINRITPRVLELIERSALEELKSRRDGGQLLRIVLKQAELQFA